MCLSSPCGKKLLSVQISKIHSSYLTVQVYQEPSIAKGAHFYMWISEVASAATVFPCWAVRDELEALVALIISLELMGLTEGITNIPLENFIPKY